ncbi:22832_t:CDS:2 [Gigaspora rosea]|nr:22832_t:CDS:2 [Gigaspora rosea]
MRNESLTSTESTETIAMSASQNQEMQNSDSTTNGLPIRSLEAMDLTIHRNNQLKVPRLEQTNIQSTNINSSHNNNNGQNTIENN